MKIFVAITVIIFLFLLYSVRIVYEIELKNFDFSASVKLKTPFEKEIYNSKNPKKKKSEPQAEQQKKKKIDLDTLKNLKEPTIAVLTEVCKILKRQCRVLKIETMAKAALEDPMENGIAFGIISGVLNIVSVILKDKCRVKKIELEVLNDFNSGEGLIFASSGTLRVRPVLVLFAVLFDFKLIKEVKNIIDMLKREEIQNG